MNRHEGEGSERDRLTVIGCERVLRDATYSRFRSPFGSSGRGVPGTHTTDSNLTSSYRGYNRNAMVDPAAQTIVAAGVTPAPPGRRQRVRVPWLTPTARVPTPRGALGRGPTPRGGAPHGRGGGRGGLRSSRAGDDGRVGDLSERGAAERRDVRQRRRRKIRSVPGRAYNGRRECRADPVFGQRKKGRQRRPFLNRGPAKILGDGAFLGPPPSSGRGIGLGSAERNQRERSREDLSERSALPPDVDGRCATRA